jgi:hypothetical protein
MQETAARTTLVMPDAISANSCVAEGPDAMTPHDPLHCCSTPDVFTDTTNLLLLLTASPCS